MQCLRPRQTKRLLSGISLVNFSPLIFLSRTKDLRKGNSHWNKEKTQKERFHKIKMDISLNHCGKQKKNFGQFYWESGEEESSPSTCRVRYFFPLFKEEKRRTAKKP